MKLGRYSLGVKKILWLWHVNSESCSCFSDSSVPHSDSQYRSKIVRTSAFCTRLYLHLCSPDKGTIDSTSVLDMYYYRKHFLMPDLHVKIYDLCIPLSPWIHWVFTNQQTHNCLCLIVSNVYEKLTDIKGLFIFWQTPNCGRWAGRTSIVSTACNSKTNLYLSLCLKS